MIIKKCIASKIFTSASYLSLSFSDNRSYGSRSLGFILRHFSETAFVNSVTYRFNKYF